MLVFLTFSNFLPLFFFFFFVSPYTTNSHFEIPKKGDNLSQKRLNLRKTSKNLPCSVSCSVDVSPCCVTKDKSIFKNPIQMQIQIQNAQRSPKVYFYIYTKYRKFSIKGAGRGGKALGGALIRERAFPPSSGFLQNENRTIFG